MRAWGWIAASRRQSVTAGGPISISATNTSDIDALTGSVATTISATSGSAAVAANDAGCDDALSRSDSPLGVTGSTVC